MEVEKVLVPEELEGVNGGYTTYDPGPFYEMRFTFSEEEVKKIKEKVGVTLKANHEYCRSDLNDKFGTSFINEKQMQNYLRNELFLRIDE